MTSPSLDQYRYTISDIKLIDPPIPRWRLTKSIFLIKIAKVTDGDNELLELVHPAEGKFDNKRQIVWSEQTLYDVTSKFTINFKILMKKGRTNDLETIGEYTNTMSGLLVTLAKKSQLSFTVKEDRFEDLLDRAKQQSEGIFAREQSWSTFFAYFDTVKTAVDPVAALNPYHNNTQQVWSIVSMVPNILKTHITQKSNVKELLQQLMDIYTYINGGDRLPVLKGGHGDKLKLLIDETCDCADFIKKYTENNAAKNFMKGPSFDGRISEFKRAFDKIFKSIQNSLTMEIAINIEVSRLLADMPYANKVGLDHETICLPGTRESLIKKIQEWVDKDTPECVLLLIGEAGTGKSAVAHTIAETLNDRLGSFFCFSRSDKGRINLLFSTISRDLADRDYLWRRKLAQAIKDIAIRKSFDPVTQFDEMIIKPSNEMETTRRVVVVIDALDESGDQRERRVLLNLLFERSSELPSNYRIIITSRPEDDIVQFHQHSNVCCIYMADVDYDDTLNDIQQFISAELSTVAKILDAVDKNWRSLLAQKAQSLFIWAKIACCYILGFEELQAAQRLRTVLSKSISSLYEMYYQILDAQPDCQSDDDYVELLKKCVGAVIVSRRPLSVSDMQVFFGPICGDGKNVKVVLESLNSLFIGTNESNAELRPIHTSLFDFFLNPEQKPGIPNRYYIDKSDQTSFAHACLRVMNGMLRFNICGLETSHLRNQDIPDFNSRVVEAIPSHLSYACRFWAYHLEYSRLDTDLLEKINDLMRNKLLYFFEVLSLLGEVEHGRSGMQILENKTKDKNSELAARAAEASQFASEFGTMMTESTPHLYLSSLPYISNRSFISQRFLLQYPQLLSLDVGQPITLRLEIKDIIAQRHPSTYSTSVAFSPQGGQIACGFKNGDLWVWDYVTGEMVNRVGPKIKRSAVCKVVFSLNGELLYCCFRDGIILTWDAKTDKVLYESNEGLAPEECDDCTISPDGRYIAFKHSQTLSFYERETRSKLFEDGSECIGLMMFSPSGRLFGFQQGGDRMPLRLWDTQRQTFAPPFVSITEDWLLETLNDNYVIAYVYDSLLAWEVWDIQTRAIVRRFVPESTFEGTFTFSPNGEYLLRSEGNKRWIWNISTREITRRFVEHSDKDPIFLTALSPDSKYIAFSTLNSTMHILAWDTLVQEEDLSKDIEEQEVLRYIPFHRAEARLQGQHLLWKVHNSTSSIGRGYFRVFDTTTMTGLKPDFQVNFSNWPLVEVSPEDDHWSIAYADVSRADLLCLWDIDEKEEFILDRSEGLFDILAFSATGDRLISCDSKGIIKIWNVRTRQLISRGGLSEGATALAFSPTGTTFWVAYGKDGHTFIEERECSESQDIINGPFTHYSPISSISVSSNDTYIFVYSDVGYESHVTLELRRLDRSTGATLGGFGVHHSPKFSPNRRYIAWIPEENRKEVKLWDLEKNIALDGFPSDGEIMALEFSNDSSTRICILSDMGEKDYHVDLWDIETRGLIMQLFLNNYTYQWTWGSQTMALYEDSLLLVDAGGMGRIWVWNVHGIMRRVYHHLNNSQSGMLSGHLQTERLIYDYKSRSENTEVSDYALVAWDKASFSPWTKSENGWMLGPYGELLFWVPPGMRRSLWYPGMSFITCKTPTKLNFDKFVHGTRWMECVDGQNAESS